LLITDVVSAEYEVAAGALYAATMGALYEVAAGAEYEATMGTS
jgi:hypothetical protein